MKEPPPQQPRRRAYRPPSRISINPLLVIIGINVLFYLVTLVNRNVRIDFAFNPDWAVDRPWTILTAMFIHADIWHLLFNMFALFIFGRLLRQFIGDNTFLIAYFAAGIAGNLLFWVINLNDFVLVVGASGAVYGIAGALVVLIPRMRIALWGIIPMPMWVFVVIFLGVLSIPGIAPSGIAWEAHLGGLVTGLVFGFFFRRRYKFMIY